MKPGGNSSGGTIDPEMDGKINNGTVTLTKLNGKFYWPWLSEEAFTTEAGPNELLDIRFDGFTILYSAQSIYRVELYPADKKLRRIGENFPPLERIENIFGGKKF